MKCQICETQPAKTISQKEFYFMNQTKATCLLCGETGLTPTGKKPRDSTSHDILK